MLGTHICLTPVIQGTFSGSKQGSTLEGPQRVPSHLEVANPHAVNSPEGVFASQPAGRRGRGVRGHVCAYQVVAAPAGAVQQPAELTTVILAG